MLIDNPDFAVVLAKYPMFGASIKRLWGSKEFITYMKDLQASVQGAAIGSVETGIAEALTKLAELHDQEYHHLLPHTEDNPDLKIISEAYPAVGAKLAEYWGRKEFGPYMTGLLQNNRGDNRQGFPFEKLMSLHSLAEQHNKDYANLFPAVDLWNQLSG